jgi:hypothetical protein
VSSVYNISTEGLCMCQDISSYDTLATSFGLFDGKQVDLPIRRSTSRQSLACTQARIHMIKRRKVIMLHEASKQCVFSSIPTNNVKSLRGYKQVAFYNHVGTLRRPTLYGSNAWSQIPTSLWRTSDTRVRLETSGIHNVFTTSVL